MQTSSTVTKPPVLVVATYLRGRGTDGKMKTWLSMGEPCRMVQTPNGYQSVQEMRQELRRRNRETHTIEEIDNGLRLTPLPGFSHVYAYQEVTLELST